MWNFLIRICLHLEFVAILIINSLKGFDGEIKVEEILVGTFISLSKLLRSPKTAALASLSLTRWITLNIILFSIDADKTE